VQLIAFPECCICGYWFLRRLSRAELTALAEPIPDGPSSQRLLELANKHRMTIGAGLIEREAAGRLYNSYVVAMPDGNWARHRKIHAFVSEHLECGSEFTVADDAGLGCRLGVLTCYDNNIIENVRATALLGAEVLLAPHQTGGCASRSPHAMKPIDLALWQRRHSDPEALRQALDGESGRGWVMRWLPSRAHDNGLFVLFANGIGPDDDELRTGGAMILDPYGRIMAECRSTEDDLAFAQLDPALRAECTGVRWMRARRPELYASLSQPTGQERPMRAVRFGPASG
jgi:predicted amidohydrolase